MKTHKNLYAQISDFNNLYIAWRKARKNKRYKLSTASFGQNLDAELLSLHRELTAQSYQPGEYAHFIVHEPKRRLISAAPFRDRVVHHALCNIIEPIYEGKFIYDSYANRRGKGTHAALDGCTHYLRRYNYALQCDAQQFFPAIDHAILKQILGRTIACPPVTGTTRTTGTTTGDFASPYLVRLWSECRVSTDARCVPWARAPAVPARSYGQI